MIKVHLELKLAKVMRISSPLDEETTTEALKSKTTEALKSQTTAAGPSTYPNYSVYQIYFESTTMPNSNRGSVRCYATTMFLLAS